jgi:hypothetical protein
MRATVVVVAVVEVHEKAALVKLGRNRRGARPGNVPILSSCVTTVTTAISSCCCIGALAVVTD